MTRRGSDGAVQRALDVLASEWLKLRSVRSTGWTLLVTAVTAVGGSAVVAVAARQGGAQPADALTSVYLAWIEYPVLAIGILGILTVTAEFASGQIRVTLAAVPRRTTVLLAKAAVVGAASLVMGQVLSFASFLLSAVVLAGRGPSLSLGEPGQLRAVVAAGVGLAAIGVLGVGLGALTRHTAGALAALPALLYLPLTVALLPAPWGDRIGRFTLLLAAYQTVTTHPHAGLFGPVGSLLVVLAWPAAALALAAVALQRDV